MLRIIGLRHNLELDKMLYVEYLIMAMAVEVVATMAVAVLQPQKAIGLAKPPVAVHLSLVTVIA